MGPSKSPPKKTYRIFMLCGECAYSKTKSILRNKRKLQVHLDYTCYSKRPVHLYSSKGACSLLGACTKQVRQYGNAEHFSTLASL